MSKSNIPNELLNNILNDNIQSEEKVSKLNQLEEQYSSKPKHKNAKRVYPFWKVCEVCNTPFMTFTKEQAVRNKTCSKECSILSQSSVMSSKPKKKMEDREGMTLITCAVCGKQIWKPKAWLKKVKKPTCSSQCNGVLRGADWAKYGHTGRAHWKPESEEACRLKWKGDKNPSWNGGITSFKSHGAYSGVKYVRCPDKYKDMSRKDGYVMEHRLVMAKHLGRCLSRQEVVHHIDHNPANNDISNLMLFPNNKEHKLYEAKEKNNK